MFWQNVHFNLAHQVCNHDRMLCFIQDFNKHSQGRSNNNNVFCGAGALENVDLFKWLLLERKVKKGADC